MLSRLTRRWFIQHRQGVAVFWPDVVSLGVGWGVVLEAVPGSLILGIHVRPASAWQHMLVAACARGESPF